jgi:hypothetical protein
MVKFLSAAAASLFVLLLYPAPAVEAAKPYEDLPKPTVVTELFKAAMKHGGFEKQCMARNGGCKIPHVRITGLDASTYGNYFWEEPTVINVSADLKPGTLGFNETVVHEFVHQLQFMFGEYGPQTMCRDMLKVEEKAYKAGAAYLAESGVIVDYSEHLSGLAMGFAMCAGEGY